MSMMYLVFIVMMTIIIGLNNCTSLALDGRDSLLPGYSLAGNETIISKNGTFELGFFSPNGTNNFYVGIWYSRFFQKAVVWVANRNNPVQGMPGVLNFSSSGHLRLFDSVGRIVWSTDNGLKGSRAVITESGNFIIMLEDGQNRSEIVWESFAHPGDTWLPGMKFWTGMKITSWKSSTDPATGLFSMGTEMSQGTAQLLMSYNDSVPYWSTGWWRGTYFSKIPEGRYYRNRYKFSFVRVSASRSYFYITVKPWESILTARVRLEEKGQLKVYFGMDDGQWSEAWSSYKGQCSEYDICGAYGLCNANDVCSCVEGFTPINDPQSSLASGCARRVPLQCSTTEGTTSDGFMESKQRYLPKEEAVSYKNEPTMEGCRTACAKNCSCTAFAFVTSGLVPVCGLWFGVLSKMSISSDNQSIFIRLAASELQISTSKKNSKAPALVISLPSIAAFFVLFVLLATFVLWKRTREEQKRREEENEAVPITLKVFSYKELRIATENFKHKLGRGAFGSVFKGTLEDSTRVAVKRLERLGSRAEKQFRAEISTIGNLQHVNLVRLYGFCVQGSQRLLVYAYMPNGSLNSLLFTESEDAEKVLDWKTRFQIALGTARGLVYLHEECRDRIIHCDIKPENVLLDSEFNPKIADFGLAKLVGRDFSHVLTTTRGTPGYLAPEWIAGLPITPKVDVYNFGMLLMEIVSGRRNLDLRVEVSRMYFPTWASHQIQGGNITSVVDNRIASEAHIEEVRRAVVVGGLCIQDDENERPSMSEVVKILEGKIEVPLPQIPRNLQLLLDLGEDSHTNTTNTTSTSVSSFYN